MILRMLINKKSQYGQYKHHEQLTSDWCDQLQQGKIARVSETLEDSAAQPAAQVDPQDELAAAFVSSTPRH